MAYSFGRRFERWKSYRTLSQRSSMMWHKNRYLVNLKLFRERPETCLTGSRGILSRLKEGHTPAKKAYRFMFKDGQVEGCIFLGLKDVHVKRAYDSDKDDILNQFYIPALKCSVAYHRLAGFFSSSALSVAARGIMGLIRNNGRMKLVVGARLNPRDIEAISKGLDSRENCVSKTLMRELEEIEDELEEDHVGALGWMVKNGMIDIKVAIPIDGSNEDRNEEGIFHQKVGILLDGNSDSISFSGSVNESKYGWLYSIEEFKVFRSWMSVEDEYHKTDLEKFHDYWSGNAERTIVLDLPTAVRNRLIEIAPSNLDRIKLEKYESRFRKKPWRNQTEAVQEWIKNDFKGIFAMATGSGKTLAALHASALSTRSTITVILVPTIPLMKQWGENEIPDFDPSARVIMCGGRYRKWKQQLPLELAEVRRKDRKYHPKNRLYVVAVSKTAIGSGFAGVWDGIPSENVQVICDEVHHIGATETRKALGLPTERRLGLSATPTREWDEEGTDEILSYFGSVVYTYGIDDAIEEGRLSRYKYNPYFAFLSEWEFEEYHRLSNAIDIEVAKSRAKENDTQERSESWSGRRMTRKLQNLLLKRALIKKKAQDKPRAFRKALEETKARPLIVFCEDNEQLDELESILENAAERYGIYTSEMNPRQRDRVLQLFKQGSQDILLAIRCLDEGLDVPDCDGCIIVASASSTRQFIQRRGRILRKGYPGKIAVLNDVVVLPAGVRNQEQKEIATRLVQQELKRVMELARTSENEWEVRQKIKKELEKYGLEFLTNL
jgi:superfamily II DNA or RNA helicase